MSSVGFGIVPGSSQSGYDLCVNALGDGTCSTLQSLGASDDQLGEVGTDSDPSGAAMTLLNSLTGETTSSGSAATPAENTPASSITDEILGAPGSVINGAASAANSAANAVANWWNQAEAWLQSNWIWIVAAVIGFVLLIVYVYGAGRSL